MLHKRFEAYSSHQDKVSHHCQSRGTCEIHLRVGQQKQKTHHNDLQQRVLEATPITKNHYKPSTWGVLDSTTQKYDYKLYKPENLNPSQRPCLTLRHCYTPPPPRPHPLPPKAPQAPNPPQPLRGPVGTRNPTPPSRLVMGGVGFPDFAGSETL